MNDLSEEYVNNAEEDDNFYDEESNEDTIEQIVSDQKDLERMIKIIVAHLFMCVEDLKSWGISYRDFEDYIE